VRVQDVVLLLLGTGLVTLIGMAAVSLSREARRLPSWHEPDRGRSRCR